MNIQLIPRNTVNLRPVPTHQFSQELLRSWHDRGYPMAKSEIHIDYWYNHGTHQQPDWTILFTHRSTFFYFDYRVRNQDLYYHRDIILERQPWEETTGNWQEDGFQQQHGTAFQ